MHNAIFESHIFEHTQLPFRFFTRQHPSGTVLPNWHTDVEFLYCISGQGWITCSGTEYMLQAGELLVVNSTVLHTVQKNSAFQYSCLIVGNEFWEENGFLPGHLLFQELICDRAVALAFEKVRHAFAAETGQPAVRHAMIRHAVLGLLILLCEKYACDRGNNSKQPLAQQRVREVTLYVRQYMERPITLDELADHLGICKSHLSREFHRVTGMTIVEYINILRCTEAKRLIGEGKSVSAAALSSGFHNLSYFTRTYKKYVGELPTANRNHKREEGMSYGAGGKV